MRWAIWIVRLVSLALLSQPLPPTNLEAQIGEGTKMSLVAIPAIIYPSWYPVGGFGGQSTRVLDAAEEHVAGVLRIPASGTLLKVGWRVISVSSPSLSIKVSLETVAASVGVPVATTDAGKSLYAANAQSAELTSFSAGIRYDAINGASPETGISVTKGDLISVVLRCTAYSSGSVNVGQDTGSSLFPFPSSGPTVPYEYYYFGGTGAIANRIPAFILEYSTGFVLGSTFASPTPASTAVSWVSTDNPDRRGAKFQIPFGCKLAGTWIVVDSDQDYQVILYNADEYSVFSGFPITVTGTQRGENTADWQFIEFPTEPTLFANTVYRLVFLPTTTTPNLISQYITPTDDGAVLGITAMPGGANFVYTTFNGAPSSGSHTWTDDATKRPGMLLVISEIDQPSGGGGGFPILGGSVVR